MMSDSDKYAKITQPAFREIKLKHKIIKLQDIVEISKIFIELDDKKSDDKEQLTVKVVDYKKDRYSFELIKPDELKNFLADKNIIHISIFFGMFLDISKLAIEVNKTEYSRLVIQSKNEDWFFMARGKAEKWVKSLRCRNQGYVYSKEIVTYLFAPILGFILVFAIAVVYESFTTGGAATESGESLTVIGWIYVTVMCFLIGILPSKWVFKHFDKIGPLIEFDFGLEEKRPKNRRKRIIKSLSAVIFLVAAVSTIISLVLK